MKILKDGCEEPKTLQEVAASPTLSWVSPQKPCSLTGGWLGSRKVRPDPPFPVALVFHVYLLWKGKNEKISCMLSASREHFSLTCTARLCERPRNRLPCASEETIAPRGRPCCCWSRACLRPGAGSQCLAVETWGWRWEVLELRELESTWPFLVSLFIHGWPDGRAGPASWESLDRGAVAHTVDF